MMSCKGFPTRPPHLLDATETHGVLEAQGGNHLLDRVFRMRLPQGTDTFSDDIASHVARWIMDPRARRHPLQQIAPPSGLVAWLDQWEGRADATLGCCTDEKAI